MIDDEYEPIEEGLEKMTVSRKLTCLQIVLTKKAPKNKNIPGYQEPIPDSEVNPEAGPEDDGRRQANRRGGRKPNAAKADGETAGNNAAQKTPGQDEEAKGGQGQGGRRRRRGGDGENRRGNDGENRGENRGQPQENRRGDGRRRGGPRGGNADGAAAGNTDAGSYNPFGDNKGVKKASDAYTP